MDFTFDSLGRLLRERFAYTGVSGNLDVDSGYAISGSAVGDPDFRRTLAYPAGFQVEFVPDGLGRLEEVKLTPPQGSQFQLAQYRRAGTQQIHRTSAIGGGAQMQTTYGFDSYRRLDLVQHQVGTGTPFQKYELTWDAGGDLIRKKHDQADGSKGDLYEHDGYHRLTGAKQGVLSTEIDRSYGGATAARQVTYALDPGQNRSSVTVKLSGQQPATTNYQTESASPRYADVGGLQPMYDGEGNLVFDGAYYYVYDFRNRIAEVYEVSDAESLSSGQGVNTGQRREVLPGSVLTRVSLADLRGGRSQFLDRADGDIVAYCRRSGIQPGDSRLRVSGLEASGSTSGALAGTSSSSSTFSLTLLAYYGYDPFNRRIVRNAGGLDRRYVYDGWREIEERVVSGGSTVGSLATVRGEGLDEILALYRLESGSWVGRTAFQDHLGSVVELRDGSGTRVETVEYDPYGAASVFVGGTGTPQVASSVGNPWLFTGGRRDGETGLVYLRNRYLSVGWGRFATIDPIGGFGDPASLGNAYAYVGNSPVVFHDPLGLDTTAPQGPPSGQGPPIPQGPGKAGGSSGEPGTALVPPAPPRLIGPPPVVGPTAGPPPAGGIARGAAAVGRAAAAAGPGVAALGGVAAGGAVVSGSFVAAIPVVSPTIGYWYRRRGPDEEWWRRSVLMEQVNRELDAEDSGPQPGPLPPPPGPPSVPEPEMPPVGKEEPPEEPWMPDPMVRMEPEPAPDCWDRRICVLRGDTGYSCIYYCYGRGGGIRTIWRPLDGCKRALID